MIDMTPIVQAVIALLVAIATCVLIPLIRSKTTLSKRQELLEWIQIAVQAAEQICQGSGHGAEKKMYVQAWLKEQNIAINDSEIDALIESAVYTLNSAFLLGDPIEPCAEIAVDIEEDAT